MGNYTVYRQATKQTPTIFCYGLGKCVEKITNTYDNIIVLGAINVNTLNRNHMVTMNIFIF